MTRPNRWGTRSIQKGGYQLGPCFSHRQPDLRTPGCGVVFLPPSRGSCSARSCPWWILATCNPVFVGGKKPFPDAPTQRRNTSVRSWGSRTLFALLASFDTGTLGTLTEIHLIDLLQPWSAPRCTRSFSLKGLSFSGGALSCGRGRGGSLLFSLQGLSLQGGCRWAKVGTCPSNPEKRRQESSGLWDLRG